MKETLDYKTIRIFPYILMLLLLVMIVSLIVTLTTPLFGFSSELSEEELFRNIAFQGSTFIEYAACVAIFTCLYRVANVSRWFNNAYSAFVGYMLSKLGYSIMAWLYSVTEYNDVVGTKMIIIKINVILILIIKI